MPQRITVNRWVGLLAVVLGCHLGRPPTPTASFSVGQVVASSAEPGLRDALKQGISAALASNEMLTENGADAIDIAVLSAAIQSTGASLNAQMFAARLQISVRVGNRSAQFSSERSYTVIDAIQGESARAEAFHALALSLTEDAAMWLATAPRDSDG